MSDTHAGPGPGAADGSGRRGEEAAPRPAAAEGAGHASGEGRPTGAQQAQQQPDRERSGGRSGARRVPPAMARMHAAAAGDRMRAAAGAP
jgi:hypothetical protein